MFMQWKGLNKKISNSGTEKYLGIMCEILNPLIDDFAKSKKSELIINLGFTDLHAKLSLIHKLQETYTNMRFEETVIKNCSYITANRNTNNKAPPKLLLSGKIGNFIETDDEELITYINQMFPSINPSYAEFNQKFINELPAGSDCDKYGISRLFEEIIHRKKPIVLHNGLVDSMMICHNFIRPLNGDITDYWKLFGLFDTRLIATMQAKYSDKSTSLSELYNDTLSKIPINQTSTPRMLKYRFNSAYYHDNILVPMLSLIHI